MQSNIWTCASLAKTEAARADLEAALVAGDKEGIANVLRDMEIVRAFVISRNPTHASHALFIRSFLVLVGCEDISLLIKLDFQKILECLRTYSLPEQLIVELNDIAFHERNRSLFFYLADNIIKCHELFVNKALVARIWHNMSTWAEKEDKDMNAALTHNRTALGLAREHGDEILEKKIKCGLKISKLKTTAGKEGIKPAERLKDFLEIGDFFVAHKCDYEAGRAYIEAAVGAFDLAILQEDEKGREKEYQNNLDKSQELAKKSLILATKHDYTNLIILSYDLLANIYTKLNNKEKADKCLIKSANLRQSVNYLSWIKSAKIKH